MRISSASAPLPVDRNSHVNEEKVEELLSIVGVSSNGQEPDAAGRERADSIIEELEECGQGGRPLENDLIFGNYSVSYVSKGNKQYGEPAGGRFRTGVGKFLFRTTGLYQSVLKPNVVVNKIDLLVLGCIPCSVGLRGTLKSIPEKKGGEDNADTAKVFFEPPVLSLPGGIHTRIGPSSTVVLKTTYVDEKVRLGKGSRGSLFVFPRGGEADQADMEQVGLQKITALGKAIVALTVLGCIVGGGMVAYKCYAKPWLSAIGSLVMLIGFGLGFVFRRGGIINDPEERPEATM